MLEPKLIQGNLSVDDRGQVGFVNEFNFAGVKRFYMVRNHRRGFIRAWHAHKKEAKYVTVVNGAAIVCAVRIDNWENPSKQLPVQRFILSEQIPSVLYIPNGFGNGFMNLTDNAQLVFFSTSTVTESQGDDFRYDARYWDPWQVSER